MNQAHHLARLYRKVSYLLRDNLVSPEGSDIIDFFSEGLPTEFDVSRIILDLTPEPLERREPHVFDSTYLPLRIEC